MTRHPMLSIGETNLSQYPTSFKAQKKTQKLHVCFPETAGALDTPEGIQKYHEGDALIVGSDGETCSLKYHQFINSYQPVAPTRMGESGYYQTKPMIVTVLKVEDPIIITLADGETIRAKTNEYLIEDSNGDYSVISADTFINNYQPVPESSYKASFDVFISYSSKDTDLVETIVNELEAHQIRCWYAPRNLDKSMSWATAIDQAIKQAPLTLLMFSKDANQSNGVIREITLADSLQCPIVPVRIDDIKPTDRLLYHLTNRRWINVTNTTPQQAAEIVVQDLAQYIQYPEPSNRHLVDELSPNATDNRSSNIILKITGFLIIVLMLLALWPVLTIE